MEQLQDVTSYVDVDVGDTGKVEGRRRRNLMAAQWQLAGYQDFSTGAVEAGASSEAIF